MIHRIVFTRSAPSIGSKMLINHMWDLSMDGVVTGLVHERNGIRCIAGDGWIVWFNHGLGSLDLDYMFKLFNDLKKHREATDGLNTEHQDDADWWKPGD